ncbi:MAG: GerMN domain-containing protein [Trueperaceae bacterium]|nr:GerMN domain-containing protein [Trueperaceae bacterium]
MTRRRTAWLALVALAAAAVAIGAWVVRSGPAGGGTGRPAVRAVAAPVFFVRYDAPTFTLSSVERVAPAGPDPTAGDGGPADATPYARALVAALARGPRAAEAARGLASAVPSATEVRSAEREGDRLAVDLSGAVVGGGGTSSMRARLEQLRWTLTAAPDVRRVALSVEGEPLEVLGGEGLWVEPEWTRPRDGVPPTW